MERQIWLLIGHASLSIKTIEKESGYPLYLFFQKRMPFLSLMQKKTSRLLEKNI